MLHNIQSQRAQVCISTLGLNHIYCLLQWALLLDLTKTFKSCVCTWYPQGQRFIALFIRVMIRITSERKGGLIIWTYWEQTHYMLWQLLYACSESTAVQTITARHLPQDLGITGHSTIIDWYHCHLTDPGPADSPQPTRHNDISSLSEHHFPSTPLIPKHSLYTCCTWWPAL